MPAEQPEGQARQTSRPTRRLPLTWLAEGPRRVLAWVRANRLKTALLAGVCALAVGSGVAAWLVMSGSEGPGQATLDLALEALDRGAYGEARELAETLRHGRLSPEESLGAPSFLLGAAAAYEADEAWRAEKEALYLVAARYLEEARDLGFPPGREGEGLFLLGRSLYLTGRLAASRLVLNEAVKVNPWKKTEIHRLLAAAYLEDANPKLLEALEHNAIYLADFTIPDDARYQGLLQRGEILLRLGKISECTTTLDQIPPEADSYVEAMVARGRVLMHEARSLGGASQRAEEARRQAAEKYRAAIKTLRLAQASDRLAVQASCQAMYLIGVCYAELGDHRAALSQFARTRRIYVDTPEALAAGFQIAELARRLGRDQEALAAYREALAAVTDVKQYPNRWLSLDELRAGMLRAYEHYRDAEKYDTCLQLARLLYPMFSRERTIELVAATYRLWGRNLLARAEDLPPDKAEPLRRQGRTQLRRAGRTFRKLAQLRVTTRHYSDDLWDSAQCYLQGHGYETAVEVLRAYLKSQSRRQHPRALVNLGEALLAVGRLDEAIAAFQECMEFHPRDAASFRARWAASLAFQEKGELDQAEALLAENLNGEYLTPDSNEWRDSLFCLGQMLHVTGRYEEAIVRLEQAVARYPDTPQAIEARYLIADSYRHRAKLTEAKLGEDLIQSARLALSEQIAAFLHAALDQYQQTRDALTQREKAVELSRMEKSLLRNCYFSIGSTLFDLKQYDQAIKVYSLVTSRYPTTPEVLEAYAQIARAYRRLNRLDEARRTVQQAKVVLDRIHSQGGPQLTTIYTADEWVNVLESLAG